MTAPVTPTPILAYSGTLPDPSDPATYGVRGRAFWSYEVGDFYNGINLIASQTNTNAVSAEESAALAAAVAEYKGAWSSLSGALAIPATVSHGGSIWMLLSNAADVTAITPGVSAQWQNVTPVTPSSGSLSGNRNRILNGDMRIAKYGAVSGSLAVAAGVLNVHLLDGWKYNNNSDATLTVARANGALPDGRTVKWLNATVGTADATIAAGQFSFMYTLIEGYDVDDLVGKTFTLHGFVKSSVTGVHCVELRNYSFDRHYLGEINITAANTPQAFSLTVAGGLPSGGTWDFDRGVGLEVGFMLAAGSDFHGSAGSWQTGSKVVTSSQVNALATAGNVFGVAEIQLEPGAVVLPFERLSIDMAISRCDRRYRFIPLSMSGYGIAGTLVSQTVSLGPAMRSNIATASMSSPAYTNCAPTSLTVLSGGMGGTSAFVRSVTVGATGNFDHSGTVVIDARL